MLSFCPSCANMLLVTTNAGGDSSPCLKLICQTCPYTYDVKTTLRDDVPVTRKEVDDVLGGDDAWKNVDKTTTTCPKCDHGHAYFMQIQIRSADEPMSTFFKCVKCGNQWREG
jgi:DNA-directed RNA polymerase III subunit RPC11